MRPLSREVRSALTRKTFRRSPPTLLRPRSAAAIGVGAAVVDRVTLAENVIENEVEASIRGGDVTARSGGVSVIAISEPTINSNGLAGGVAAGLNAMRRPVLLSRTTLAVRRKLSCMVVRSPRRQASSKSIPDRSHFQPWLVQGSPLRQVSAEPSVRVHRIDGFWKTEARLGGTIDVDRLAGECTWYQRSRGRSPKPFPAGSLLWESTRPTASVTSTVTDVRR